MLCIIISSNRSVGGYIYVLATLLLVTCFAIVCVVLLCLLSSSELWLALYLSMCVLLFFALFFCISIELWLYLSTAFSANLLNQNVYLNAFQLQCDHQLDHQEIRTLAVRTICPVAMVSIIMEQMIPSIHHQLLSLQGSSRYCMIYPNRWFKLVINNSW